jgi:GTPase SAR1 family protein
MQARKKFKIILIGDNEEKLSFVGALGHSYSHFLNYTISREEINFEIWNTASQAKFASTWGELLKDANAVIFCGSEAYRDQVNAELIKLNRNDIPLAYYSEDTNTPLEFLKQISSPEFTVNSQKEAVMGLVKNIIANMSFWEKDISILEKLLPILFHRDKKDSVKYDEFKACILEIQRPNKKSWWGMVAHWSSPTPQLLTENIQTLFNAILSFDITALNSLQQTVSNYVPEVKKETHHIANMK